MGAVSIKRYVSRAKRCDPYIRRRLLHTSLTLSDLRYLDYLRRLLWNISSKSLSDHSWRITQRRNSSKAFNFRALVTIIWHNAWLQQVFKHGAIYDLIATGQVAFIKILENVNNSAVWFAENKWRKSRTRQWGEENHLIDSGWHLLPSITTQSFSIKA